MTAERYGVTHVPMSVDELARLACAGLLDDPVAMPKSFLARCYDEIALLQKEVKLVGAELATERQARVNAEMQLLAVQRPIPADVRAKMDADRRRAQATRRPRP